LVHITQRLRSLEEKPGLQEHSKEGHTLADVDTTEHADAEPAAMPHGSEAHEFESHLVQYCSFMGVT
jgi:hypothetical protein